MSLKNKISQCMVKDRHWLRKKLSDRLKPSDLDEVKEKIELSIKFAECRKLNIPKIEYNESLPITEFSEKIKNTIQNNQVTIIAGDTGSGKTTQIPKICIEAGRGVFGKIAHTQPRRIAARSVAHRIAQELGEPLGKAAGFKVRFAEQVNDDSYIKVITDGILLSELVTDPWLNEYDTIIIDEAHERSLNIDFLLGIIKGKLLKRKDLKVIITSATIDPISFSKFFNNAPVIEIPGRTYPVDVQYLEEEEKFEFDDKILHAIDRLPDRGDILVFLSGEGEIYQVMEMLNKKQLPNTQVMPLFSRLNWQQQQLIFKPSNKRKIILSTNIAETSITVSGIKYVIDLGTARVSRYNYRSRMQRLPIERISKASAKQRAGRCGRTEPGICIRLYSRDDFDSREDFNEPEITRTNLATIILTMLGMKLGDIEEFPFMLAPQSKVVKDGIRLLQQIQAITKDKKITRIGRDILNFPLDPQLGVMLYHAKQYGCLKDVLVLVSALSIGDVRDRPKEKQEAADLAHMKFITDSSDFSSILKIWDWGQDVKSKTSNNKLKKECRDNYISYQRFVEWSDVHQQLVDTCKDIKWTIKQEQRDDSLIHTAILHGLFNNIGNLNPELTYTGANNKRFLIFPGSSLKKKKPKWIVANDIVETSNVYARTVAKIEPEWIVKTCSHLIKYNYASPFWDDKGGRVVAKEQASIFGLHLYKDKNINYERVDKLIAKKIMILHMLVRGECSEIGKRDFYRHNCGLINEVLELERRQRKEGVYLIDEEDLVEIYSSLMPDSITNRVKFMKWIKFNESRLRINKDSLFKELPKEDEIKNKYPSFLELKGIKYNLEYEFNPSSDLDGVTILIPANDVFKIEDSALTWGVPGNLQERVYFLLKSLPKSVRVDINPIQVLADAIYKRMISNEQKNISIIEAIKNEVFNIKGADIPLSRWRDVELPNHLKMKIAIIDDSNRIISRGDNLDRLRSELKKVNSNIPSPSIVKANDISNNKKRNKVVNVSYERWSFDDIDKPIVDATDNVTLTKHIRLKRAKEEGKVILEGHLNPDDEKLEHNICVAILMQGHDEKTTKYLIKQVDKKHKLVIDSFDRSLIKKIVTALYLSEFVEYEDIVLTKEAFLRLCGNTSDRFILTFNNVVAMLASALSVLREVKSKVALINSKEYQLSLSDIDKQLSMLFSTDFIYKAPVTFLCRYPVYLKALLKRLEKIGANTKFDLQQSKDLGKYMNVIMKYDSFREGDISDLRFDIEELRVSLFAQELKTIKKVSYKRLDNILAKLV